MTFARRIGLALFQTVFGPLVVLVFGFGPLLLGAAAIVAVGFAYCTLWIALGSHAWVLPCTLLAAFAVSVLVLDARPEDRRSA